MEASQTVIKNEDIMNLDIPCETCEDKPDWGFPTVKCMECMALKHREAQAEISFPLGEKQGIRKTVNHLKKYYLIDVPEDMIKEIEND